jgi:putative sterol carrier protein
MSFPSTASELFAAMPNNFNAGAAGDLNATIQFDLTGDGGGTWAATVADGTCKVVEGAADSPTLILTMDTDDFMAMSRGNLNPMNAFMSGKIKLQGDMGLAMKLQNLFNLG